MKLSEQELKEYLIKKYPVCPRCGTVLIYSPMCGFCMNGGSLKINQQEK